jgi:hypothetical protein
MKSYTSDAPIKLQSEDRFRRYPFAKRIAETIIARPDPGSIVVGIYGAWGEGKTSVLNFIGSDLRGNESVICVCFNPWRFKDEATLLLNYFKTLADALGRSISSKKEKIGKWFQDYGNLLAPLSLSFFGVGFSPGQTTAETGKMLSSIDLEELRNRIEGLLVEEKKRIVVLMDDIDRLDKSEIYAIFRLVKLSADFSYTAYILAFDDQMVSSALQERYASGMEESGQSFLEKIVQVPLRLPPADQISLRQYCFEGVDEAIKISGIELTEEQVQSFVRHFVDGIENRLKTPRMCKRYANALTFALPILAGEVNPVDLMLIEGIRVFYPSLYTFIRRNRGLFTGTHSGFHYGTDKAKETAIQDIEQAIGHFQRDDQENIRDLLKTLFPRLSGLYGNVHYGSDWEITWSKEQRVSSNSYFDRYFSYAIPEGDVPDLEIEQLLNDCVKGEIEQTTTTLRKMLSSRNAEKVIKKLRYREKTLDSISSEILGKSLALVGETFPNPDTLFSFTTPFSQASILISQLAKNIPVEKRLDYAKEVILSASPLPFSVACLRWFRTEKEKKEGDRIFSTEIENELGRLVAQRIYSIAKDDNLYLKYGRDAPLVMWTWAHYEGKGATEAYVKQKIEETPESVSQFLKTFITTAWGMESGLPIKGDFERDQYDYLSKIVSPEIVLGTIKLFYGDGFIESLDPSTIEEKKFEEKIILQFIQIHQFVIAELNQAEGEPSDPPNQTV